MHEFHSDIANQFIKNALAMEVMPFCHNGENILTISVSATLYGQRELAT